MTNPIARCVTCKRDMTSLGQGALHKMHGHIVQAPERARVTEQSLRFIRDSRAPNIVLTRSILT